MTKLPDNAIGHGAEGSLRGFGVDTSKIVYGGDRPWHLLSRKGREPAWERVRV